MIRWIVLILILVSPAWSATYYLNSAAADDTGDGSVGSPFKTLDHAKTHAISGDTVLMATGNYGPYLENSLAASRTDWITYRADTGAVPVITYMLVYNTSTTKRSYYLKFDGIKFKQDEPSPLPDETGYIMWTGYPYIVQGAYADYLEFVNCVLSGFETVGSTGLTIGRYLSRFSSFSYCDHVTFDHCEAKSTCGGIAEFGNCDGSTVKNCYIHDMLGQEPGVRISTGCTNSLIHNNHFTDSGYTIPNNVDPCLATNTDDYFPCEDYGTSNWHGSTVISIRSSDVTITNNVIHNTTEGFAQTIYLYNGYGAYQDIVIENNLFYDTASGISLTNLGPSAGIPCKIRNNTFVTSVKNTGIIAANLIAKFGGGVTIKCYPGNDGTGLQVYNNIFISDYNLPDFDSVLFPNFVEDHNFFWLRGGTPLNILKGEHSRTAIQNTKFRGNPNWFDDVGYATAVTGTYNDAACGSTADNGGNVQLVLDSGTIACGTGTAIDETTCYVDFNGTYTDGYYHIISKDSTTKFTIQLTYAGSVDIDAIRIGYSYALDGVTPMFVNPGHFRYQTSGYTQDHNQVWNFHLISGSPAINAGDAANDPDDSLGSIGSDGFIVADGIARDASHHSIGAYEYDSNVLILDAIGSRMGIEGVAISPQIHANTASAGTGTITYSYTSSPALSPAGTIDTATGVFAWTPNADGTYLVTFTVTDVGGTWLSGSEIVTIIVDNPPFVNTAPVLTSIRSLVGLVNEPFGHIAFSTTDIDGDTITYTVTGLPTWATWDNTNKVITGTPLYPGIWNVTVTVSDGTATDSETFEVEVSTGTYYGNIFRSP